MDFIGVLAVISLLGLYADNYIFWLLACVDKSATIISVFHISYWFTTKFVWLMQIVYTLKEEITHEIILYLFRPVNEIEIMNRDPTFRIDLRFRLLPFETCRLI